MTDGELLELAAKAAGVKRDINWLGHPEYNPEWNALDDDGDALRLAVKLGMTLFAFDTSRHDDDVIVEIKTEKSDELGEIGEWIIEPVNDDPYAATRRAIIRAAAQIGKQK